MKSLGDCGEEHLKFLLLPLFFLFKVLFSFSVVSCSAVPLDW